MPLLPTRRLGRSGLDVTPLGLGMASLGRPGYINIGHRDDLGEDRGPEALERRAHQVLDAALDAGIRYVDCARSYGLSEQFVADWLQARGAHAADVVVGSKWGYRYTAAWRDDAEVHEVKEHSRSHLDSQWCETQDILGPRVRLYQIHSATQESGVLRDPDVMAGLSAIRERGVAIGLSTSGPNQAATIRAAVATGVFDTVQATFNALEPSAGDALAEAHDAGLGVIVKEAVANGRLTDRGDVEPFIAQARARGITPDALAIGWVLAHPFVDVVLSGVATVDHLHANLRALTVGVDPTELAAIMEKPDAYWRTRGQLAWN